ncbi:response regulator [Buttiauxella gaviniae]|uniref:response regulator n=1 Tax=Buttiauxella gaviniae TaxID=82990 RepID=UPI0039753921
MNKTNIIPPKQASIMLLDDHAIVLQGLNARLLQENDLVIIGLYTRSNLLLEAMRVCAVDLVIIDYELEPGDTDGINLIKMLRLRYPDTRILVLSAHHNPATVATAMRAGASGFMGKSGDMDQVILAIRTLLSNLIFLEKEMRLRLNFIKEGRLSRADRQHITDIHNPIISLLKLTPKEREVIRCFLNGMTVTQIAEKQSRSLKTISGQKQSAMRKLGLSADHELFIIKDELLNSDNLNTIPSSS